MTLTAISSQSNWASYIGPAKPAVSATPSEPPAIPLTENRAGRPSADRASDGPVKMTGISVFEYNRFLVDWLKDTFDNQTPYAQVVKDGKVVATFDNGGGMTTSDPRMLDFLRGDDSLQGPASAQHRAEQIAAKVGGEIVRAPTALTQDEWIAPLTWSERQASYASYREHRLTEEDARFGARGIQA